MAAKNVSSGGKGSAGNEEIFCRFPIVPLKRAASVRSSSVDKVIVADEEAVRLCNYTDVYYNERITDQMEFSNGSANPKEIERFSLKSGDVLITKDSETPDDIGVPALVELSAEDVVCGYHLAMLRPHRSMMLGRFLFWCLNARPVKNAFSIRAQGITRFGLTLGGIGSVPIPCPDLPTQKSIADFLDRETTIMDRIIEKAAGRDASKVAAQNSFINILLEKRDALITAAVTGQIDVRGAVTVKSTKPDRVRFRVLVGAEIVYRHRNTPKFGRVKNQKIIFGSSTFQMESNMFPSGAAIR